MNLQPLGKRVIIEKPLPPAENKTSAGIILPGGAPDTPEGRIVAVGDEVKTVSLGDVVLYPEFGLVDFSEGQKNYVIADEADLVARRVRGKK